MTLVLVALIAVIVALVVQNDRQHARFHEMELAHRLEVAGLCQRIQAPQVAVVDHSVASQQVDVGVTHPLSDEQAAEQEEAARVIAEMERLENEVLR